MTTKAKHTPGFLKIAQGWQQRGKWSGHKALYPEGGPPIAMIPKGREDIQEANARRLAACWNACAGIPMEQLEVGCFDELVQQLQSALSRLEAIEGLIQDQVDEKIRGERKQYNWSAIFPTISEEASAGAEDIKAALAPFQKDKL